MTITTMVKMVNKQFESSHAHSHISERACVGPMTLDSGLSFAIKLKIWRGLSSHWNCDSNRPPWRLSLIKYVIVIAYMIQ